MESQAFLRYTFHYVKDEHLAFHFDMFSGILDIDTFYIYLKEKERKRKRTDKSIYPGPLEMGMGLACTGIYY